MRLLQLYFSSDTVVYFKFQLTPKKGVLHEISFNTKLEIQPQPQLCNFSKFIYWHILIS